MNLVRDQFEINYFGPLNIIKAVLPYMRRERSGHVMILSGISRICVLSNNEGLVLTIYSGAYRHTRTRNVLRSRLGPRRILRCQFLYPCFFPKVGTILINPQSL